MANERDGFVGDAVDLVRHERRVSGDSPVRCIVVVDHILRSIAFGGLEEIDSVGGVRLLDDVNERLWTQQLSGNGWFVRRAWNEIKDAVPFQKQSGWSKQGR